MRALDFHRRNRLDRPLRPRHRTLPVVFRYLFDEFVEPWPEEIISRVESARDWAWAVSVWDVNGLEGLMDRSMGWKAIQVRGRCWGSGWRRRERRRWWCTGTSSGWGWIRPGKRRMGGSIMRESASSKRASGEGSGVVKSTTSLGRGMLNSQMNWPKQRGHVIWVGLL
ncbi:hypothetical protein GYH30_014751 [Glycine max]|nr:hypothetical protein GYH30_014751 [Glycine max]